MRIGKGTRALVSGGCGFIGSHLVRKLLATGCRVLNIDKLTYAGNPMNLADVSGHAGYSFLHADITDVMAIDEAFRDFQPNFVFHLAAESHVDRSVQVPMDFIHSNITGTAVLLQTALGHRENLQRFIHVSTDEVYGALGATGSFTEASAYGPRSPYSASKAAGDHLVRAWGHTYGFPVIVTHSSNNYGPFQHPEKLIPMTVIRGLRQKEIPVYGSGLQIRDWIHVEDHCEALMQIAEQGETGKSYHIGANEEHRNLEVVKMILEEVERLRPSGISPGSLVTHVADRPGHDFRYALDASRLRNELGWEPKRLFPDGLQQTVSWYAENEAWWKPLLQDSWSCEKWILP